jgi:hypothetical protein
LYKGNRPSKWRGRESIITTLNVAI